MTRAFRLALLAGSLVFVLGAGKRPPGLGDVTEVRVFDHPNYTRVVIELSREARYETGLINRPARFYIDIGETWIEAPLRAAQHEDATAPLRRVRGGQNTLRRARVVLELDRRGRDHRTFHLYEPFRIVTDIFTDAPRVAARGSRASEAFDMRPVRRIAIDPGHGGKDPGARGAGGILEKDVVLRVARKLRARLEREGFEAFLTREGDAYLPLEVRTDRANARGADLFISIHANASPNRRTHGVETYLLDTRYDRQTARVAARENGTTVGQLNELQRILASLRLGYNERFASRLADDVQGSLLTSLRTRHGGTRDLGVKRGPFLVLFMADMPAVLVELGFLSNRAEARRLDSKAFANAAADGIASGILRYRQAHARSLVAGR